MKRSIRFLTAIFAILFLLSSASCSSESQTVTTAESPESTESVPDDETALNNYLNNLRSGAFDSVRMYGDLDLAAAVTPAPYQNLTYPKDPMIETNVTDQEVDDYLALIYLNNLVPDSAYTDLTAGRLARYDAVLIDYEGTLNGEKRDDLSGTDRKLVLGSHTFVEGFEEALLSASVGDTVTFSITFSHYYADTTVAGRKVQFKVTVKSAQRPEIPEITVETINELVSAQFADMDAVREDLKKSLEQSLESQSYQLVAEYLQGVLIDQSTFTEPLPEEEMTFYRQKFQDYFDDLAADEEISFEDYLEKVGMTEEEYFGEMEAYAAESVKADLLLRAIAENEGIEPSDEQISAFIRGVYQQNASNFTNLFSMIEYYNSVYGPWYFYDNVLRAQVLETVYQTALAE